MRQRTKRRVTLLQGAASALFVALAGWYLGRDPVPHWVRMYSRPSPAARFLSECDHVALLSNRGRR